MLEEYESITYERFMTQMREQWLRRLHLVWLIQGHLVESDAMQIVNMAEDALAH